MDGKCYGLDCEDGTARDTCSNNKPYFCMDGALVSKCPKCGCPDGLLCDRTTQICYERPEISIVSPLENQRINVGEEKKVVVSGMISKGREITYSIEGNDSRFILSRYDASSGEFAFENVSPVTDDYNSFRVSVADKEGNLLANRTRDFGVIDAPAGMTNLLSLQDLPWEIVQFVLLLLFVIVLLNAIIPFARGLGRGMLVFPEGSIVLVEGTVGSGEEEFCLNMVRRKVKDGKFCAVLSYDPRKEEGWFSEWEKNRLLFIKAEPDINEIALSISKMLGGEPQLAFINVLNLLIPKYNSEELTDFLSTNFAKLRDAKCGAIFCVDKGINEEVLSAIEGLFDGVVEFRVEEKKGKLNSYFRTKEFKLKKFDSDWRKFK